MSNPGYTYGISNRPTLPIGSQPIKWLTYEKYPILQPDHCGYMLYALFPYSNYTVPKTVGLQADSVSGFRSGDIITCINSIESYNALQIEVLLSSQTSDYVRLYYPGDEKPVSDITVVPGGQLTLLHTLEPNTWLISGTGIH